MLNFYKTYVNTYRNGELISCQYLGEALTDTAPEPFKSEIVWDNLGVIWDKAHGSFGLPFNVSHLKKGCVISFDNWKPFDKNCKPIKEWKDKEIGMSIEIRHKLVEHSISDVLDWHDCNKAIQYLTERGLSVINKKED